MTDGESVGLRRLTELAEQLAGAAIEAGFSNLAGPAPKGGTEPTVSRPSAMAPGWSAAGQAATEQSAGEQGKTLSSATGVLANLNPIVAGLMRLFGGGSREETTTLVKIERPAAVRYQGGVSERTGWGLTETDYAADGRPRMVERAAQTPVVVQVQAMDSRSFLDHRDEIASAVRQALLESHGLGDVMREV